MFDCPPWSSPLPRPGCRVRPRRPRRRRRPRLRSGRLAVGSSLEFLPGLGQLFVDPATLPAGPFLAYDHDGRLVSTIFMVPVADLNPDKRFEDLAAPGGDVDHVDHLL